MQLPYKKMVREKTFLGFTAMCDCGHKHNFSVKDFNINPKDLTSVQFRNIYTCPACGDKYDGMFDIPETSKWKELSPTGVLITICLLVGLSYGGYQTVKWATDDSDSPEQVIINEQKQWDEDN